MENIIEITEDVSLPGTDIVIEKGDKIEVIEAESKTAKCPDCGGKYLVQTGYCVSCKKKVGGKKKEAVKIQEINLDQIRQSLSAAIEYIRMDGPGESSEWVGGWFGIALDDAISSSASQVDPLKFKEGLLSRF